MSKKLIVIATLSLAAFVVAPGVANAQQLTPITYIEFDNVDNPDVDQNSSCSEPDTSDAQALSPAGTQRNAVEVSACLREGAANQSVPAVFESTGKGTIVSCKNGTLSSNGNSCRLPGSNNTGTEYLIRVNNTESGALAGTASASKAGGPQANTALEQGNNPGGSNNTRTNPRAGPQTLTFCQDLNNDGDCDADEPAAQATVDWEGTITPEGGIDTGAGGTAPGENGPGWALLLALALPGLAAGGLLLRRRAE